MSVVKTILKNTEHESVIKVQGTAAAATIDLQTDIVAPTQETDGATQKVVITGVQWTGATGGVIQITRNSVVIMTLVAEGAGALEMNGQAMVPDSTEFASDIVVTISGAQAECWLKVKKVSGYKSKIETGIFGSYDDPTQSGV